MQVHPCSLAYFCSVSESVRAETQDALQRILRHETGQEAHGGRRGGGRRDGTGRAHVADRHRAYYRAYYRDDNDRTDRLDTGPG